jgi:hypothetical protein
MRQKTTEQSSKPQSCDILDNLILQLIGSRLLDDSTKEISHFKDLMETLTSLNAKLDEIECQLTTLGLGFEKLIQRLTTTQVHDPLKYRPEVFWSLKDPKSR